MKRFVFEFKRRGAVLRETVCVAAEDECAAKKDAGAWLNSGETVGNLRETATV